DKKENSRIVEFKLDKDLSKTTKMKTSMVYGMAHDVELTFDLDSLKIIELTEEKDEPVVEMKKETKTEEIEFETVEKNDTSLEKSKTKVEQKGEKGEKEVTYEVTYTDDEETNRKVKDEKITKKPVNKIILK